MQLPIPFTPQLDVVTLSTIDRQPLDWLWRGKLPLAKLSVLAGDPNLGKSFLALDLAARVSAGKAWPDGSGVSPVGDVLLLSAEDDVADTIRPRLESAGADLDRVQVLRGTFDARTRRAGGAGRAGDASGRLVSLARDVDLIEKYVCGHGGFRLVVVDPISAYFDGMELNRNNDVRRVLGRLGRLAESSRAAVLLVSHLRKDSSQTAAIYRTLGSVAFTAVARALWTVVKDPAEANRRLLVPVKMNLVEQPLGQAFWIVDPGRIAWEEQPIVVDADERGADAFTDTDADDRLKIARRWLKQQLTDGPRPSNEIKLLARGAGIPRSALWQAKKELCVKAVKQNDPPRWDWELPDSMFYTLLDEDLIDPVLDRMPTRKILGMWKDLKFEQEWVKRGVARVEEEMGREGEGVTR